MTSSASSCLNSSAAPQSAYDGVTLRFVSDLAVRAGDIVRAGLSSENLGIGLKLSRSDVVTKFDLKSEQFIKGEIKSKFPCHQFIGEETSNDIVKLTNEGTWIVDPIDGTSNFVTRHPCHCISIAYAYQGEIVFGVVYIVMTDELFCAEKDGPSTLNGRIIHVSDERDPKRSLVSTGLLAGLCHRLDLPEISDDERRIIEDIKRTNLQNFMKLFDNFSDVRRHGSCAIDCCFVACGRVQGFCEMGPHIWDFAAGMLIVRQAGGIATGYTTSGELDLFGQHIVCANSKEILQTIHKSVQPSPHTLTN